MLIITCSFFYSTLQWFYTSSEPRKRKKLFNLLFETIMRRPVQIFTRLTLEMEARSTCVSNIFKIILCSPFTLLSLLFPPCSYIISPALFAKFMYHRPHDRVHYRALIISEVERLGNVSVRGEKIRIHDILREIFEFSLCLNDTFLIFV